MLAKGIIIFYVYEYKEKQIQEQKKEKKVLEIKVQKLENLMNRNYGQLKEIGKGS